MKAIERQLAALGEQPVLFISDLTQGDQFVFGTFQQLEAHPIPETAEISGITNASNLLVTLDFESYDEEPAIVRL